MLYVPELNKSLISVSSLEDKGYQVKFHGHIVYIRCKGLDRRLDWMIGRRSGKVSRLQFEPLKALFRYSSSSHSELWHRRMAHLHHGAVKQLRQFIIGVPHVQEDKHKHYKGCALGENMGNPFP